MMSGRSHVCFKQISLERRSSDRFLRRFDCDLDFSGEVRGCGICWKLYEYGAGDCTEGQWISHTLSKTPGSDSTGLTRFIVDMAGALVSPRMSTPKLLDFLRGRGMIADEFDSRDIANASFFILVDAKIESVVPSAAARRRVRGNRLGRLERCRCSTGNKAETPNQQAERQTKIGIASHVLVW